MSREIQLTIAVAVISGAAALIRFGIGLLLREPLPPALTPTTARAREFLRACYNPHMPPEARLLSSFEAVYFCCLAVSEHIGMALEQRAHPDIRVVELAFRALGFPKKNWATMHALLDWRAYPISPQPKACTDEDAFLLARTVYLQTRQYLQG
ncbi:protein of unknown function [Paraburkholderia kururiensis]|uniref:hypothetical protein n=1 Tax=Paraburkholderia kururiensis TaxID=984307 RepID=UPI0039A69720